MAAAAPVRHRVPPFPCDPEVERLGRRLLDAVGTEVRDLIHTADPATFAVLERRVVQLVQVSRARTRGA